MKLNFSLLQVFLLLISTMGFSVVFAQEKDSLPTRSAHLGLAYPISTDGQDAGNYSNGVSLHALVGVSGTERSVALSGLGNIIHQDARGAAVSGLFNYIGGSANGTQIAGLCNVNKGNSRGVQVAGLLNVQNRHTGVAMAGVGNTAVEHSGLQLAGVFNIAKITKGVQVSGLLNKSTHAQHQLAGLINIASKVEGVQIAGLINIADESDYPIGILNFIKNGEMQLGLSVDDMGSVLLNFRSGGRVTYGIL